MRPADLGQSRGEHRAAAATRSRSELSTSGLTGSVKALARRIGTAPVIALAARHPTPRLLDTMRRFALVQLEVAELSAVTEAIRAHPGARLLVFGVGNDSRYWRQVNLGGTTDFIEDDLAWIERIKRTDPRLSIHPVRYETSITDWRALLDQPDRLALDVPGIAPGAAWDVILVDAPAGFDDTTTGRMKSIYFASTHAPGGDVFVHDCHREAEIAYCDRYLGADNFVVEVSWLLRHYRMPPAP